MRQQVTRQEIRRERNREIELGRDVRREPGWEEDQSRRRSKRNRRSSRHSEGGSLAVLTLIWLIVLLILYRNRSRDWMVYMGKAQDRQGNRSKSHRSALLGRTGLYPEKYLFQTGSQLKGNQWNRDTLCSKPWINS